MADLPPFPASESDSGVDTDVGSGRGTTTGPPRWVYASGIIIVVLVIIVLHLAGIVGPGVR